MLFNHFWRTLVLWHPYLGLLMSFKATDSPLSATPSDLLVPSMVVENLIHIFFRQWWGVKAMFICSATSVVTDWAIGARLGLEIGNLDSITYFEMKRWIFNTRPILVLSSVPSGQVIWAMMENNTHLKETFIFLLNTMQDVEVENRWVYS